MENIKDRFSIGDVFERDFYSTVYEAYDKKEKQWCFLVVSNVKTSWEFWTYL